MSLTFDHPAEATDRAFAAVLAGPTRRLRRLLRHLAGTTTGYADATLERLFGSQVHELLNELARDQRVERDGAWRWRLTGSGRALARRFGGAK